MKRRIVSFILSVVFIMCGVFPLTARADFGDYGGDSDYGDFDFDFDFGGDSDYDYDDDDDYGWFSGYSDYSSWGGGGSSGSDFSLTDFLVAGFFIACIVLFILRRIGVIGKKGKKKNGPVVAPGAQPTSRSSLYSPADYLKADPTFSEAAFLEKLSNLYVRFQNAWQAKDLEELRPFMTDPFYAQMDRQLDRYRRDHQTNRIERIAVLGTELTGWKQEKGNDVMIARLKTRIVDYVVDDKTGKVIRGSNTTEKFMDYEWELVRTTGKKTSESTGTVVHNCPNCGAVMNINQTAKCEYCGSIVTVDNADWAVQAIRGISQRTGK